MKVVYLKIWTKTHKIISKIKIDYTLKNHIFVLCLKCFKKQEYNEIAVDHYE